MPVYLKDLGLTGSDLGLLVAAFALSQMIISPFGGTLADKLGKKLIICIGLILFSVSEFMFAVGHNFFGIDVIESDWWYECWYGNAWCDRFDCRCFTKPSKKQKNFGYMSAIINSGFILGPGIGGFMAEVSHRMPFYFCRCIRHFSFHNVSCIDS